MAAQLKIKSIVYSRFLNFQTVNFLTASFHSVKSAFILYFWAKYVFLVIGKTRELVEETQKVELRIQKYEPQTLQTPVYIPVRISQSVNNKKNASENNLFLILLLHIYSKHSFGVHTDNLWIPFALT